MPIKLLSRPGAGPTDHEHVHHNHVAPADSFVLIAGGNPDRTRVELFFHELPDGVWRAKGFMNIDGGPHLIQYTMGQLELSPAGRPANEKIVFIGRNMNRTAIEARFAFAKPN